MNNDDTRKVLLDTKITRPYTATGGRTKATVALTRMTLVCSTRRFNPLRLEGEHAEVLLLCAESLSVAEVSGHMKQPMQIVKVLLGDLIDMGAVETYAPTMYDNENDDKDTRKRDEDILKRLLAGLYRQLDTLPSPPTSTV